MRALPTGALVVLIASLVAPNSVGSTPILHEITFSAESLVGTPFGLTSLPPPITGRFVVDDSIFQPGTPEIIDALPGFSFTKPVVIGDASFTTADLEVTPGGRVVGGKLVEIFFLAQFIDLIEGQRILETYFFPAFEWVGTDFNPSPPSEFIFGRYSITVAPAVPEPASMLLLGSGFVAVLIRRLRGLNRSRIAGRSLHPTAYTRHDHSRDAARGPSHGH